MIRSLDVGGDPFRGLPGSELVTKGLQDLAAGLDSSEALLLQIAAPRLAKLKIVVVERKKRGSPEHALYSLLEAQLGREAHSQYNALLRRMASFAGSLEREQSR